MISQKNKTLTVHFENEYVVVDSIEYQFALRYQNDLVCIFNEMLLLNQNNYKKTE